MVKFDPQKHHRRSIRLKGFDYANAGAYFVTIVTYQRNMLFGEIVNREMRLNRYGEIVQKWWQEIPVHFANVETGAFVIMPNHIHGIIWITKRRGTGTVPEDYGGNEIFNKNNMSHEIQGGETPPRRWPTLGQIVGYFKYQSAKEMNLFDNTGTITKFWQRNYYERIIRDDRALENITNYIHANPMPWAEDDENPIHRTNGDQRG